MGKKHFWFRLFILVGILLSLYLIFYPDIQTAIYEHQAEKVLSMLDRQIAEEQKNSRQETEKRIYDTLFEAMYDYNQALYKEKQIGLTGPEVYEKPQLSLPEYGIEEGSPVGSVSIPEISLELPLYLGASETNLAKGAAVLGETSCPIGGENTNCVIAGHRGYKGIPYFRNLDRLQIGDKIYLNNYWGTLTYIVRDKYIIDPDDTGAILIQDGKDQLTLLTCHPYTVGTQRMLVACERTEWTP